MTEINLKQIELLCKCERLPVACLCTLRQTITRLAHRQHAKDFRSIELRTVLMTVQTPPSIT